MSETATYIIIQTGFIGDIALAMFTAESIRVQKPDATIIMVTTPIGAEIVSAFPTIVDDIVIFDKRNAHKGFHGLQVCAAEISRYNPTALIAVHRSLRTTLLTLLSKATIKIGFKNSALSFMYSKSVHYRRDCHEIERNNELLKPLGFYIPAIHPPGILSRNSTLLNQVNSPKNTIVIAPGSVWHTKKWPAKNFVDLIRLVHERTDYTITLIGSKSDVELCNVIKEQFGNRVLNFAGTMTLLETMSLLKKSDLLIANDSAPIHLASLVNCKTVALFGPTHPAFGFGPLADKSIVIQQELSCRPCSIHGQNECPLQHHNCLNTISPEIVFEQSLALISQ